MTADGKRYDIRLDWRTAVQGYTITQIIPTGGTDQPISDTQFITLNGVDIWYRFSRNQEYPMLCGFYISAKNTTNENRRVILIFHAYKAPDVYLHLGGRSFDLRPLTRTDNELWGYLAQCKDIYSWELDLSMSLVTTW